MRRPHKTRGGVHIPKTSTEGNFHVSGILETSKCEAGHQARGNRRESESAVEDLQ